MSDNERSRSGMQCNPVATLDGLVVVVVTASSKADIALVRLCGDGGGVPDSQRGR